MNPVLARIERNAAAALAMLFAALALYGAWSAPGLAATWGVSPTGMTLAAGWAVAAGFAVAAAVRPPGRWGWALFGGVAIALRFWSLAIVAGRTSPSDPQRYLDLAHNLIAGRGMFLDDPAMAVRVYAEYPPAYPLLLAAWGAVAGLSGLSVLALSTLLDLATAWLIARLGARLGEARAGVAAGALYLIWPSVLLNAPLAQKESLELLLVVALALGWIGGWRRPWQAALAIGVPAGLLALTQPGMAALAALFGMAAAPRLGWRLFLRRAAGGALVSVVVLLPWWVRNWMVLGAFVPLTSVGGLSLWIGENPDATGNWMPYPAAVIGLPELECARTAGRMAVEWMRDHPVDVLRLNAAKFVRAMGVGQFAINRIDAMQPSPGEAVTAALLPLTHGAQMLMLGTAAASMAGARRRPLLTALMLAVMAQLLLFGLWFEFSERHRELLTPFLLLGIAVAATGLRPRTAPSARAWARPAA